MGALIIPHGLMYRVFRASPIQQLVMVVLKEVGKAGRLAFLINGVLKLEFRPCWNCSMSSCRNFMWEVPCRSPVRHPIKFMIAAVRQVSASSNAQIQIVRCFSVVLHR